MMHRPPGGKRIRMDDPPPPEYDALTAASPYSTPYYSAATTPQRTVPNIYPDHYAENDGNAANAGNVLMAPQPMSVMAEPMVQENGPEQENAPPIIDGWENGTHEEEVSVGRRVTRARARGGAPPPPTNVPNPTPAQIRRALADERPTKKRAAGRRSHGDSHKSSEDEASLYFIVRQARTSLQSSVDDWIENYKMNRDAALLALMQFFIHASGCKGKITTTMQTSMEHASIIRKMTEEFEEESGEYPLIMSGQQWKKFRGNFCDFIQTLVKQCQYSIIYDQYLMDNLISLLTGLSDSQVRAFRHTATLAAMKLMTALVEVALVVSVNLDNTQRQYESERQKTRDKRAADRLETLMSKRQELEENMDEIKNMLTYMFKSVFVHRYRDTLPEIRAICMAEIGIWMKKFHQNFLDDSYLKYIGWTLHDKVGEVRLKCLQALQPLYSSEELKGKLELFTSKFKDRIVAMTLDKEYDVAVQAVKLVISILKHHRDILTDKDCEHVYELVYSSHRLVAQAAGEFLNERLFVLDEDANNGIKTRRGKKRLPNTPLIRDLVQFFIESELHEHAAYLVDSLIESNEMMKDWECMTDLLLEEPGPKEEALDDRQETSLIEIMVCCIRQAATGEPPVGRGPTRKVMPSVKEVKQIKDDKERLTDHFMQTLPLLLEKYGVDSDKLTNLLSIPQFFNLERYTSSRQEGNLDQLLKKMQRIVERTTNNEVLETCAKTLEILCTEGTAIFTRCDVARSTLIDSVVNRYKEAMDDWRSLIEGEEEPNEEETFQVTTSLKKVSIISSCHNMGNWNVWDSVFHDIQDAKDNTHRTLPEEAIKYCFGACFTGLLWDLNSVEEMLESGSPVHHELDNLKGRLHSFMQLMQEILEMTSERMYRDEAYVTLCDLLVVFCNQLSQTNPLLDELKFEPDENLRNMLNDFIQTYVFIDDDDEDLDEHSKIEELHKRRNFLASFCKLIVYNMLPVSAAGDVFKHYVKYYNEYGDIIKATLGKAREINKVNCARTMLYSLITLFQDEWNRSRTSEEFIGLKELAKRFALSFGLDAVKNRDAITVLHRDGIVFAVSNADYQEDPSKPPPNLPFLEILSEFTNKLLKQDKRVVLAFLDRRVAAGMPSSRGEDWQPLLLYRNSLVHGETDQPTITSKRAYGRRRKEQAHGEDDLDDELLSDDDFPVGKPTRPRKRPVRTNHSTENATPLDVLARAAGTALRGDAVAAPTDTRRRRSRAVASYEELSDLDIDLMNLEDEDENDDSESESSARGNVSSNYQSETCFADTPAAIFKKSSANVNQADGLAELHNPQDLIVRKIAPPNQDTPNTSSATSRRKPRLNVQRVKLVKPYRSLRAFRPEEDRHLRSIESKDYKEFYNSDSRDEDGDESDTCRSRSELEGPRDHSEEMSPQSSKENASPTSVILGSTSSNKTNWQQKHRRLQRKNSQQASSTESTAHFTNSFQHVQVNESPKLRSTSKFVMFKDYSEEKSPQSSKENLSPSSPILGSVTSYIQKGRPKQRRHQREKNDQTHLTKSIAPRISQFQTPQISGSPGLRLKLRRLEERNQWRSLVAHEYDGTSDSDLHNSTDSENNNDRLKAHPVVKKKQGSLQVSKTSGNPGSSTGEECSDDDFQMKTKKKKYKNRSAFGRSSDRSEGRQLTNQCGGNSSSIVFGAVSNANSRYHPKTAKKTKRLQPSSASLTKTASSGRNKVRRARILERPKPRLDVQVVKHKTTTPVTSPRYRFYTPLEDMSSSS